MSEAVENPEQSVSDNSRNVRIWIIIGFAVLATAFAFYLRLFTKVQGRASVFDFFFNGLLPAAMVHTALLLLLTLAFKIRARGILIFWLLSAALLLSFGGWTSVAAFVLVLLFGFVVARTGSLFARYLLPPASQSWGVSLALGLLAVSSAGAFFAWFHLFKWWVLGILLLIGLVPDLRSRMSTLRSDFRSGWQSYLSGWNTNMALTLQALFLLCAYAYVAAMVPEANSDAVRFYWPYIRLLRHYSGFFDAQHQWSYIIPQAGVTYAAAMLSLLGSQAIRLSMLLAWLALIGMVGRRWVDQGRGLRYAVAVVVASSPVVLWVACSLMLDIFACVAISALALVCVEGREPGTGRFWIGIGICAATAWAAKYTALAYALPLVAYASIRSFRAKGALLTFRGMILSAVCFLGALSPWFANSYQQSGNPVFPFFLKLFPSTLWPRGVADITLTGYRLPAGWRGWLLWPIDLTYHTSRFVEGYDGKLGITLLVLLILAIPVFWRGSAGSRALATAGIIAAAILWTKTSYLRYWLPSLWLMAMAASGPFRTGIRSKLAQLALALAAFAILIPQVLFTMVHCWSAPQGWPWDVYTQKISWQAYLGDQFQGLSKELERSHALAGRWPKVWFTGYETAGHLEVQAMEATVWELTLHTISPRSKVQYLSSAGCDFWIVNEDDRDAHWFMAEGISRFFWNEQHLVTRYNGLAVYRMPSVEEVLREFDARAVPGTELIMNGGIELGKNGKPEFWTVDGDGIRFSMRGETLEGRQCIQLRPKTGVRQGIALPPGVRNLEFVVNARSVPSGQPATLSYPLFITGFEKDPATVPPAEQTQPAKVLWGKAETVTVGGKWQQYRTVISIPNLAQSLFVGIYAAEGSAEAWIDSVHLYSR